MGRRASIVLFSVGVLAGCGGGSNATPPLPATRLTLAGPASVVGGSVATYQATEFNANGGVVSSANVRFSLDSTALGTIDPTSGVLTASTANNAGGHVIATDSTNAAITGALAIKVLSSRPATAGDSLSYAGTFTSSIANNAISTSGPVVITQSATVAQTVAVASDVSGKAVLNANESDTFGLSTLTTKTTSTIHYEPSGASTDVRLIESSATDSNNATYESQYTATSGLLTVEPENPGIFGPNDASQTYSETDPGINVGASGQNVTTIRITQTNGSYQETTTNADGSLNTATQKANGSGSYAVDSGSTVEGAAVGSLTFGAPSAGTISIAGTFDGSPQTTPVWYALPLSLYTETDTIAAATKYDSRCSVPARFGQTSSVVTQSIKSVDAVFGNLENQTTIAYDVVGVGTVCSIFTDSTQTFYDYTSQESNIITIGSPKTPILTTNTTEVLSITAGTVSGQPVSTESVQRSGLSIGHLAVIVGRERFRHAVREAHVAQAVRLAQSLRRTGGVR